MAPRSNYVAVNAVVEEFVVAWKLVMMLGRLQALSCCRPANPGCSRKWLSLDVILFAVAIALAPLELRGRGVVMSGEVKKHSQVSRRGGRGRGGLRKAVREMRELAWDVREQATRRRRGRPFDLESLARRHDWLGRSRAD